MDQPLSSAIDQDAVSVGSTIHDTTQQFSTLVLRAGRTSLPSLHVQDFSTPLTRKAFNSLLGYLMPLRPRIWLLLLAKPKCVWKSGQPAQNNMKVISTQKRNGISICPRHGMLCSLIQHKFSPSHASHVVSKLRQVTCATRMVIHSWLRTLTRLIMTVATSFHKIARGFISQDWPRFSKSRVSELLMPLSTNSVSVESSALLISGRNNWMRVALIPTTLPRRYLSHGSQCPILHILPIESAVEEQARANREVNVKANNNDLMVLDQAPAKAETGSLQKAEVLTVRCGVEIIRQAAVAACCPFACPDDVPWHACHLCMPPMHFPSVLRMMHLLSSEALP